MTDRGAIPFTPGWEPTADFLALLLLGRKRGYLSVDDLLSVMTTVELTPDVIEAAVKRVRASGIAWHDDILDVVELEEESSLLLSGAVSAPARPSSTSRTPPTDPAGNGGVVGRGDRLPDSASELAGEAEEVVRGPLGDRSGPKSPAQRSPGLPFRYRENRRQR